ncbi:ATP-grasp domain-containing protein [Qipengyuania sp.]|uniref:ATP-grasp domain-containing protein n=1 Tax=Qipengyuania sp. TaxID=2004515 RepID=UPI003AF5F053
MGLELVEIEWRAPLEDFEGLSLVLLGTAWDYQDHPEEFLDRLDALAAQGIAVCNPPEVVRWNANKRYLAQLAERGAAIVPTLWPDDIDRAGVEAAMDHFDTGRVVVKRQVGAGGLGQHSFARDALPEDGWSMGRACMVQPFLPSVVAEGEYTFVFVDGHFSHGVLKRAGAGDYRIQSLYGGYECDYAPEPHDLTTAEAVIAALPFADLLYARVDMARLPSGELAVMEAELIEPYLYPEQGPHLGERLAQAILARI